MNETNFNKIEKMYTAKIMKNRILRGGVTFGIVNLRTKSTSRQSLSWAWQQVLFLHLSLHI